MHIRAPYSFNSLAGMVHSKRTAANASDALLAHDHPASAGHGSGYNYVNRYDVLPDGTLTNGKLLIDLSKETERGVTDGMRVDTKGNLYETGPGGVWIISPEGKHLGTIRAPEQATNVGFGDADKKTLYIAARTGIYRIRVNTPGI